MLFDVMGGPVLVVHHLSTILLCALCLYPVPWIQYHALFFAGWSEFSTLLLGVADVFRRAPWLRSNCQMLGLATARAFAVAFLSVRVVCWGYFFVGFARDCYEVRNRLHSVPLVALCLSLSAALTAIQCFWAQAIARRACCGKRQKVD